MADEKLDAGIKELTDEQLSTLLSTELNKDRVKEYGQSVLSAGLQTVRSKHPRPDLAYDLLKEYVQRHRAKRKDD